MVTLSLFTKSCDRASASGGGSKWVNPSTTTWKDNKPLEAMELVIDYQNIYQKR